MEYRTIFAERLTLLRKERKLTQLSIGEHLGITHQAYSLLEKSKRSPSFEILTALADFFDVSLDFLVGRSDIRERR